MPTPAETDAAAGADVAVFGEKDTSKDYPAGTKVTINGEEIDLSTLPDFIGGKAKGGQALRLRVVPAN